MNAGCPLCVGEPRGVFYGPSRPGPPEGAPHDYARLWGSGAVDRPLHWHDRVAHLPVSGAIAPRCPDKGLALGFALWLHAPPAVISFEGWT